MLTKTFLHIPGIGPKTEKKLWQCGVADWHCALECDDVPGFALDRWKAVRRYLQDSLQSLNARDHAPFADALPASEHWRSFSHFHDRVAYVDIETTGLGKDRSQITVIGVYDGMRTHSYIAGDNMDQFAEDIESYSLLVTFNGQQFDVPFLRQAFPQVRWNHLHCDLRWALKRIGHSGGLKKIEKRVGLSRHGDIDGLSGYDAVRLWHQYRRGDSRALRLLVDYNAADVENLEYLMEMVYARLHNRLLKDVGDGPEN